MCDLQIKLYNLDELDTKFFKRLEQDTWQNSVTLTEELHVSPATIRRRMRRLIQNGVLRAVAIADPDAVALPLTAIIALNIAHQELDYVIRTLTGLSEITWCSVTTGRFDVIVLAQFHSTEELHEFIREKLTLIEGVKDSETFVCLHVEKGRHFLSID